jgi:drug/metabolite transporter (DMT)-like permease
MQAAELVGGIALATMAAACFDSAVVLQAVEVRASPAAASPVGLGPMVGRPRWQAATALSLVGWPLQLCALALAPLTVVQPTLALGLVIVLVVGSRLLHEPVGVQGLIAAGSVAVGVAVLAWSAPDRGHVNVDTGTLAAVLGGLTAITAGPWLVRRRAPGDALVVAAGCGFAAAALTSKLLVDALTAGDFLGAAAWGLAAAALAGLGLGDEMAALQRVTAARVAAGAFALQVIVPVALTPLVTNERWAATPLGGAAIVIGLVAVVAGALALETTPSVSRLVSGAPPE